MNEFDRLSVENREAVSGNDTYRDNYPQWKFLFESFVGGAAYQKAGYLTRYILETDDEYNARIKATPLDNHCQSVISVYNSFLFRIPPTRELAGLQNDPLVEEFLWDADYDGRTLTQFMKEAATWSSVFGHSWVILSKPNVGAVTAYDEQVAGVRPYASILTPLVVLDWNWTRLANGRLQLDYFKYIEDITNDIYTIKEWTLDTITTYVVDVERDLQRDKITEDNQLGKIPAVCVYNGRSIVQGVGVSDITDIASMQKHIYNMTSEVEQAVRHGVHASLVKTEDTEAGSGPGSIIQIPENLDPGLMPRLLEFNGTPVESIYKSINQSIEAIDKMANIGAVRATESRTMSGVAMETEFSLLNARLSEKADNLELAEEAIWTLFAMYQGKTWDGNIDYPDSFNVRDAEGEIRQLKTAKETATSEQVIRMIDEEIIKWMGNDDSEENV